MYAFDTVHSQWNESSGDNRINAVTLCWSCLTDYIFLLQIQPKWSAFSIHSW